jgi:hypothetical protein
MLNVFNLKTATPLLLIICACSSMQKELPLEVEKTSASLQTKSPSQFVITQSFRKNRDKCESIESKLAVSIRRRDGAMVPLQSSCSNESGYITTESTTYHPAGDYTVTFSKNRRQFSPRAARVLLRYRNADFNSAEDAITTAAPTLEPNQKLAGEVAYFRGDQTDWVRLSGKNTSAELVWTGSSDTIEADVFAEAAGSQPLRKVGALAKAQPRRFTVSSDNLLVRFRAKEFSAAAQYQLMRRDSTAPKKGRVQVVDCYPTGAGMALALLKVSSGVAINDGVVISASSSAGERRTLGKCKITTLEGTEASCELSEYQAGDWVDFRAEKILPAGDA